MTYVPRNLRNSRGRIFAFASATILATAVVLVPAVANSTPTTGFSVVDVSVPEGNPTPATNYIDYPVKITRTGTTTVAGSVKVSTLDGTATAGTGADGNDYRAVSTPVVVNFAAGATSAVTSVRIYRDTTMEPDESFYLLLSAPTGASILDGLGQVTMTNDDQVPVRNGFSIGDTTGSEATGTVSVPVLRYGPNTAPASVKISTSNGSAFGCPEGISQTGCDYTSLSSQLLSFPAGQAVVMVRVALLNDKVAETDERFSLNLSAATGAPIDATGSTGTVTIVSSTTPPIGLKIGDAAMAEGNTGNTTMTFTITRVGPTETSAAAVLNTAFGTATATDLVPLKSVPVNFSAGEATKTVTVSVIGDATIEPNEVFTVKMTSSGGSTIIDGTAVGTIVNDD